MNDDVQLLLKKIPSMDLLLGQPWVLPLEEELGREAIKALFTDVMNEIRTGIRSGQVRVLNTSHIIEEAKRRMEARALPSLVKVVNATGVVVHTNMGRSCLGEKVVEAVSGVASGYSTLEYSLETGSRGHRNAHVEWLLCQLTGAEAALVVNNNAGAVILCLAALAREREVIISRGELVEIGGSFRIPDIMSFSGADMIEVGTTNQTHLWDYERAIGDDTAMLLKVHPSNFKIQGFCGSVSRKELAALAKERGLIFMEDLGSGMLIDMGVPAMSGEPTVRECIEAGVDVVTFSGDKMLGGPQIGCIAGSAELIGKLRKNPFLRALRVDKMCLAAFESTLRLYLRGEYEAIPTLAMLRVSSEELKKRAFKLERSLRALFKKCDISSYTVRVAEVEDAVGGGAFPETPLPGWGVWLRLAGRGSTAKLTEKLRLAGVPVISGVQDDQLVFHARTLCPEDDKHIADAFYSFLGRVEEAE